MAALPPLSLPVSLTVGEHTLEIGELTLGPGEDALDALAELFLAAAVAVEASGEGGDDGTP
ncbi:hypothetical protein ACFXP3_14130 [Streptomyces sp. NPDC059096]|uniref:hypothetical protein n=1 Tax=Streptomyces sp. NPDC059096 TaxID=3346727 RepID=UPI00369FD290